MAVATLLVFSLAACNRGNEDEKNTDVTSDGPTAQNTERVSEDNTEKATNGESATQEQHEIESTTKKNEAETGEDTRKVLMSDTGTSLNLIVRYTCEKNDDGTVTVNANISLESYALNVTARNNSNYLKVGDETFYFSTDAIDYKGDTKTEFDLGSHTFTVKADGGTVPVYAVWHFNGTYNDKPINSIIIDSEITL